MVVRTENCFMFQDCLGGFTLVDFRQQPPPGTDGRLERSEDSVSPLLTELAFLVNSIISALKRFAAKAKLLRVLVLSSKNIFTTTLPRKGGAFLTERVLICSKPLAVSRIYVISSELSSLKPSKCLRCHLNCLLFLFSAIIS